MTNEQILKKAIEKAVENGYNLWIPKHEEPLDDYMDFLYDDKEYFKIIFSHEFAEAFWPGEIYETAGSKAKTPVFLFELASMVKEKDPIKYLEQFL